MATHLRWELLLEVPDLLEDAHQVAAEVHPQRAPLAVPGDINVLLRLFAISVFCIPR